MGYGKDEQDVFELYKAEGQLGLFQSLKPKLSARQMMLVNSFYKLSSERKYSHGPLVLPESVIRGFTVHNQTCGYPIDLFIHAISEIDSQWLKHQSDKIKRLNK